ncbi:hypothetical protein Taro_018528 [Colocasia esculenta]|uniref:Uncharacterized protein n=1 Tax=Colocasia esculenta TaxID=4460 RepID=A0A843URL2_COLES|nr:hypothetical protein [Colocasia esculenta]
MTVLLMTACQVLHSELCAMMTPHGFGAHAADPGERLLAVGLPTRGGILDAQDFWAVRSHWHHGTINS